MTEPFFQVKVEGVEVTPMLSELTVEEFDDRASRAVLRFSDSEMILADVFHEGLSVTVDLGREAAHGIVFKGLVTNLRGLYPVQGEPWVELTAMSSLIRMSFEPRSRRWWNTTLSQVVRELALSQQFLPGDIAPPTDPTFEAATPLRQVEETDLAFLFRLADAYGSRLTLSYGEGPDRLGFVAADQLLAQDPLPEPMRFNHNLYDFQVAFDAYATCVDSEVVSTDPLTGDLVSASATHTRAADAQWVPDPARLARLGERASFVTTLLAAAAPKRAALADYWRKPPRRVGAPARAAANRAHLFGAPAAALGQTGRGRASGHFQLRPQRRVSVEAVGGRFSGDWYVTATRHKLNVPANEFFTEFECSR